MIEKCKSRGNRLSASMCGGLLLRYQRAEEGMMHMRKSPTACETVFGLYDFLIVYIAVTGLDFQRRHLSSSYSQAH